MLKRIAAGHFRQTTSKDQTRTAEIIFLRKIGSDEEIALAVSPSVMDRLINRAEENTEEQELDLPLGVMSMTENVDRKFGSNPWYYRFKARLNQEYPKEFFMTEEEYLECAKDALDYI